MKYIVMRSASLMEDEGKDHLIGVRDSKEEAEKVIEQQVTLSKGYFTKGEYYIATGNDK